MNVIKVLSIPMVAINVVLAIIDFKNVHGLSEEMVAGFEKAMEDWPGEIIVDPAEKLK